MENSSKEKSNQRHENHNVTVSNDDLSFKELVTILSSISNELFKRKLIIFVTSFAFATVSVLYILQKPTTFRSAMIFLVTESDEKKGSKISSPFDQIEFEGIRNHKITEFARSSSIVTKVLLSRDTLTNLNIAQKIVEVYNLKSKWSELDWTGFDISGSNSENISNISIYNRLHEILVGNRLNESVGKPLAKISYNKKTELFTIEAVTTNKALSQQLRKQFYTELSDFYTEQTVGRPKNIYTELVFKEDSLRRVLDNEETKLAYAYDRTRGIVSSIAKINISKIERKIENTSQRYNDIKANRQKIEFILQTETPEFKVIDETFVPFENKISPMVSGVISFVLGCFIFIVFYTLRFLVRSALED